MRGNCLSCDPRGMYLCKHLEVLGGIDGGEPDGCSAALEYEEEKTCPGFEPRGWLVRLRDWLYWSLESYLYRRLFDRRSTVPAETTFLCPCCKQRSSVLRSARYHAFTEEAGRRRQAATEVKERDRVALLIDIEQENTRLRERIDELLGRVHKLELFRRGPRPAQGHLRARC